MARALRIERFGGRYHVTARGNERKDIFRDDTDHFHYLELLGQLGEHFGVRVHAYIRPDGQPLPLVAGDAGGQPEPAMHWLNASYCRGQQSDCTLRSTPFPGCRLAGPVGRNTKALVQMTRHDPNALAISNRTA